MAWFGDADDFRLNIIWKIEADGERRSWIQINKQIAVILGVVETVENDLILLFWNKLPPFFGVQSQTAQDKTSERIQPPIFLRHLETFLSVSVSR